MAVKPSDLEGKVEASFDSFEGTIDRNLTARWKPGTEVAIYLTGKKLSDSNWNMIVEIYGADWDIRQDDGPNKMLCFRKRVHIACRSR